MSAIASFAFDEPGHDDVGCGGSSYTLSSQLTNDGSAAFSVGTGGCDGFDRGVMPGVGGHAPALWSLLIIVALGDDP